MKSVKMLACMAGSGFVRNVGDVVEVPDDEAARLVAAGFAADVPTAPVESETEVATGKKVEEQPKPRGRPRKIPEAPTAAVLPALTPAVTEPPAAEMRPENASAVASLTATAVDVALG